MTAARPDDIDTKGRRRMANDEDERDVSSRLRGLAVYGMPVSLSIVDEGESEPRVRPAGSGMWRRLWLRMPFGRRHERRPLRHRDGRMAEGRLVPGSIRVSEPIGEDARAREARLKLLTAGPQGPVRILGTDILEPLVSPVKTGLWRGLWSRLRRPVQR